MSQGYARDEARRWVRRKRVFYLVLLAYLSLSVVWFSIDALTGSGWWFYWPMLGVGIGVAIYGVVMLGAGGLFGTEWERRQIDRYVEGHGGEEG
ncbi:MAG TPA: 2TM domain-containing protein [Actinomycetota bacterium]|nr:2TM domain-containing protein [Actinomycetota bacterium]